MNFIDGEVLLPELQEKRKEKRKAAQGFKHMVETHTKKKQLSKRNKVRLLESFETIPECNARTF